MQALQARLDASLADSNETRSHDDAYLEGETLAPSILKGLLVDACGILRELQQADAPDVIPATKEIAVFVDEFVSLAYGDSSIHINFLPSFAHAEDDLVEDPLPSLAKCGASGALYLGSSLTSR